MIRIFSVHGCAVCCDLDPRILHALEAELLRKAK
jgi:hypothetical protein